MGWIVAAALGLLLLAIVGLFAYAVWYLVTHYPLG
jgi:hypothetical protein